MSGYAMHWTIDYRANELTDYLLSPLVRYSVALSAVIRVLNKVSLNRICLVRQYEGLMDWEH